VSRSADSSALFLVFLNDVNQQGKYLNGSAAADILFSTFQ
jgi:hypothetical protein